MISINTQKALSVLGKYKYLLIVVAVGAVLLLLPSGKKAPDPQTESIPQISFDAAAFEERLSETIAWVNGAGRVKVMVTLKSDMELKLYEDRRENQSRDYTDGELNSYKHDLETSAITINGSGGTEEPIVVRRMYPEFGGVFVVCDGADSADVKLRIVEAVSGLTGLGADKITIAKMKQE